MLELIVLHNIAALRLIGFEYSRKKPVVQFTITTLEQVVWIVRHENGVMSYWLVNEICGHMEQEAFN